ncbi:MAG: DUF2325 domain-containing protein [Bacillota bacterium]
MSIFVVGADHLGEIEVNLKNLGCRCLTHLKGRKNIHRRNLHIPEGTDLVLVLTDYVDHNIARSIKDSAKSKCIPVIFSRRSWACLSQKINCLREGLPCKA